MNKLGKFAAACAAVLCGFGALAQTSKEASVTVVGCDEGVTLTNFPVSVRLAEGNGFSYADCAPEGADLRFRLADGTALRHEIDEWNPSGESIVWVLLPEMKRGSAFVMCWGDPSASEAVSQGDGSVWQSSGHIGVWHCGEAAGDVRDSAGNGLAMRAVGDVASSVGTTGKSGTGRANALGSAGRTQLMVDHNPKMAVNGVFTVSFWLKITGTISGNTGNCFGFGKRTLYYDAGGWTWEDGGKLYYTGNTGNQNYPADMKMTTTADSTWRHYAMVADGTSLKMYENGVLTKSATLDKPLADNCHPLSFGNANSASYKGWRSVWDEVRYRGVASDADWVKAEYQATQPGFTEIGAAGEAANDITVAALPTQEDVFVPLHTYYVSTTGDDTAEGKSEGDAFKSLSKALEVAVDGDLIRVLAGTHAEMTPVQNPSVSKIAALGIVDKAVRIVGDGEASTELVCRGLSSTCYNAQGIVLKHPDAYVTDLAITGHNGGLNEDDGNLEWGMAFHATYGHIVRCRVTKSGATTSGSYLGRKPTMVLGRGATMTDSFVTNNNVSGYSKGCGGVWVQGGLVERCVIADNGGPEVKDKGCAPNVRMDGGLVRNSLIRGGRTNPTKGYNFYGSIYASGGILERCVVSGTANQTESVSAGGAYLLGTALMRNVLVTGCSSRNANSAGGVYVSGEAELRHVTVVGNTTVSGVAGVKQTGGRIYGSVIADNVSNVILAERTYFSDYPEAGADDANGNISADPLLEHTTDPLPQVPADIADYVGFILYGGSPARNAARIGYNLAGDDLRGEKRPAYGRAGNDYPDMGAYEVTKDEIAVRLTAAKAKVLDGDDVVFVAEPSVEGIVVTHAAWTLTAGGATTVVETDSGRLVLKPGDAMYVLGASLEASVVATFEGGTASASLEVPVEIQPQTVFVSLTGSGTYPYDNWEKATSNLCEALEAVGSSETRDGVVRIADGTYANLKTVSVGGLWNSIGYIAKPVRIVGNDADPTRVVLKFKSSTPCGGLFVGNGRAVLSGVTLTGSTGVTAPEDRGGVLHVTAGLVTNCWVRGCRSGNTYGQPAVALLGGAMVDSVVTNSGLVAYMWPKSAGLIRIGEATMERCRIVNNSTWEIDNGTGVIVLENTKSVMRDCVVSGNYTRHENSNASRNGFISMNAGLMERCAVVRNTSSTKGKAGWTGGVDLKGGKMTNCLVADNVVTNDSFNVAGVRISNSAQMVNCTVAGNACTAETGDSVAGLNLESSSARIWNTLVCGNGLGVEAAGVTATTFLSSLWGVDAKFRGAERGNYAIGVSSPAYGIGDSSVWQGVENPLDLALQPRLRGRKQSVDAGCYECQHAKGLTLLVR